MLLLHRGLEIDLRVPGGYILPYLAGTVPLHCQLVCQEFTRWIRKNTAYPPHHHLLFADMLGGFVFVIAVTGYRLLRAQFSAGGENIPDFDHCAGTVLY